MGDKILIQCVGYEATTILKVAMVNAIVQAEHCCSRRERREIRQFILECAAILSKSSEHSLNQDSAPENSQRKEVITVARKTTKLSETPMDIVAGNIASLMQRNRVSEFSLGLVLGFSDERPFKDRMNDPSKFTGNDLNHICSVFGVTIEQLAHDGFSERKN